MCQILSLQDTRFPHLDTHSQLPAAGSVSAPGLEQPLHFPLLHKKKKKVVTKVEECVFSYRMVLHEKQATTNLETKKGFSLPWGRLTRGELKHWNFVVRTNRQRNKPGAFVCFLRKL